MTPHDVIVAFAGGWVVVVFIVLFIVALVKFVKRKHEKEISGNNEDDISDVKESKLQKCNRLVYVFECMALAFLSLNGGINRPMITTGQKPKRKEIMISLFSWFILVALVTSITLLLVLL